MCPAYDPEFVVALKVLETCGIPGRVVFFRWFGGENVRLKLVPSPDPRTAVFDENKPLPLAIMLDPSIRLPEKTRLFENNRLPEAFIFDPENTRLPLVPTFIEDVIL